MQWILEGSMLVRIILIAVYSNAMQENVNTLLYNGLIEELVDILEVKQEKLMVGLQLPASEAYMHIHGKTMYPCTFLVVSLSHICMV